MIQDKSSGRTFRHAVCLSKLAILLYGAWLGDRRSAAFSLMRSLCDRCERYGLVAYWHAWRRSRGTKARQWQFLFAALISWNNSEHSDARPHCPAIFVVVIVEYLAGRAASRRWLASATVHAAVGEHARLLYYGSGAAGAGMAGEQR